MKRTGEFVLAIIGLVLNVVALVSGFVLKGLDSVNIKQQLEDTDTGLTAQDINNTVDMLGSIGTYLIVLSVISIILTIIALVFLKGNKKPKLAGWLFIISGIISLMEVIPGILYIIVGIMALARKPKNRMS